MTKRGGFARLACAAAFVFAFVGCDCDDDSSEDSSSDDDADDDAVDDDIADADADDDVDDDDDTAPDDDTIDDDDLDDIDADLAIDAGQIVGLLNRRLNGGHVHDSRPTPEQLALRPAFWRRVASSANRVHWDCDTETFAEDTLADYHDWLDTVQAGGVEPMIALSYVPECMSENGHPKAPPLPEQAAAYETYIRSFLREFVSGRIDEGKAPLRYFEAWNEPDIQFDYANTGHGHGFVGLLDDYEERIFVPLGHAVMDEEVASGVDIELGVAASFDSRPFIETYPHLEDLMLVAGVPPELAAWLGPTAEWVIDRIYPDGFVGLWSRGGFRWPDRLVARAETEGIEVEFISWHHYVNNPFEGPGEACMLPEIIWFLHERNPLASVNEYYVDALDHRSRYPGKEIFVTEWDLSAGCDDRPLFEIGVFHAAALVAMQRGGMDGAISLSFPTEGATAIAHWMFVNMADHLVLQQLNEDSAETGVWTLASVDHESPETLTLLIAQWHSLLENAESREIDVGVVGLEPGEYDVALYMIDSTHDGAMEPDVVDVLTVADESPTHINVPLDGIAATFVEIRRAE